MKSILVLSLFFLFSCASTENDDIMKNGEQTWKLVKMSGSFQGSETTGSAMEWQETIVLDANKSFVKTRIRNGETIIGEGTYTYLDLEDGKYLELTFPEKNELVGNCYGNSKETYWVISKTQLRGTWMACDGPGLEYELFN